MENTRLVGKDWLDSMGVVYTVHLVSQTTAVETIPKELGVRPTQVLQTQLWVGEGKSILLVKTLPDTVDVAALELHTLGTKLRPALGEEYDAIVQHSPKWLHPFMENYLLKVLDEHIFDEEKIFIFSGEKNEILEMDSTALKYSVGVNNGIIAPVCIARKG